MNKWYSELLNFYKKHQNSVNIFLLIILTVLVFHNSLSSYFLVVDDFNSLLHTKRSITKIFITNTYGSNSGGNYRPFEVLSHLLDSYLYGVENSFGRHQTNILIHIFNVILVYVICSYLAKRKLIGLIAGLIFAVFIIHSYSLSPVSWISGRSDLIVTFFYLLTIILFIRSISKGSVLSYLFSLAAFLFALMSKEMAVTLPFVILLYIRLFPNIQMEKETLSLKHLSIMLGTLLLVGILLIVLAMVFNPDFIAGHFSQDGIIKDQTINKIYYLQNIAVWGGVFITASVGLILLLLNFSKRISDMLFHLRHSIPFFFVLLFFLIARFAIVGGFGGAYNSPEGNVILQFNIDSFMRDIFALTGLVWPVGSEFNIDIFKLQIEHNFIFYSVSSIFLLTLVLILIRLIIIQSRALTFSYLWIFITLLPAHNSLIPSWQFQARFLYLPSVGFCILISMLIYKLIQNRYIPLRLSKFVFITFLFFLVTMNSLLIIKNNEKLKKDGEIMQRFVSDMKKYQSKITDKSNLYFITFPFTPINSISNVFIYAYMDEVLNFIDSTKNYEKQYNYNILSYIKFEEINNFSIDWLDKRNFIIDGIDPAKYFFIPNEPSVFDEEIKKVYKTVPHAFVQQLHSEGEIESYSLSIKKTNSAVIKVLKLDKDKAKLKGEFKDPLNKHVSNSLFFTYEKGHFRLVKEYSFEL